MSTQVQTNTSKRNSSGHFPSKLCPGLMPSTTLSTESKFICQLTSELKPQNAGFTLSVIQSSNGHGLTNACNYKL